MAKRGMKRPEQEGKKHNDVMPVKELQGKAKTGRKKGKPIDYDGNL